MLQETHPERLSNKEGSKRGHMNLPGKGKKRIDFECGLVADKEGNRRDGMEEESIGRDNWNWGAFCGQSRCPIQ